jgi:hypothetical protein
MVVIIILLFSLLINGSANRRHRREESLAPPILHAVARQAKMLRGTPLARALCNAGIMTESLVAYGGIMISCTPQRSDNSQEQWEQTIFFTIPSD